MMGKSSDIKRKKYRLTYFRMRNTFRRYVQQFMNTSITFLKIKMHSKKEFSKIFLYVFYPLTI